MRTRIEIFDSEGGFFHGWPQGIGVRGQAARARLWHDCFCVVLGDQDTDPVDAGVLAVKTGDAGRQVDL